MANPALTSLIIFVLIVGTALSLRQVLRLYPEISWVNGLRVSISKRGACGRATAKASGTHGGDSGQQPCGPDGYFCANAA
jgi:hypothetical protein